MSRSKLPQLIIIGAAKAATTWVAHQLRKRRDVFMPGPEPHYFSREFVRGEQWYRSLFEAALPHQFIAEKSADYLADPEAPRRIAALLPQVQLLVQLRDPVARAYSDYCMLFRRGEVDGDVARHLNPATAEESRFLHDGLYGRHIRRFLDYFPEEQLKLLLHEEIKTGSAAVIADLLDTLGLPPCDADDHIEQRINDSATPVLPLLLRRLPGPLKRMVAPLRGDPLFEAARGLIARPVRYPPLSQDMRRRLADFYQDDIEQLTRIARRDFACWTTREAALS